MRLPLQKPSVWLPASDSYCVDLWSAQLVIRRSSLLRSVGPPDVLSRRPHTPASGAE
jgi:hypothetical protein